MNLLYSNDRPGEYPPSWYAATVGPLEPFAPLRGETRADVCVVGAGFTGLSAALHLAEQGLDVVLLEAHRVGFGASGRNGGQLGSGQRMDQHFVEKQVGRDDAVKLWELAEEAKDLVKSLISRHKIDCHLKPGIAHMAFSNREVEEEHAYADMLAEHYNYPHLEKLDRAAAQALCPSPKYVGGTLDMTAAHLHPLAYALGLARAAREAGVRIFERTEVHRITEGTPARVATDKGVVSADHVVLACNGYLGGLNGKVAARVMPINNFIAATEPLGDDAARVLTRDVAVADT
ncbi:MAG: NAD(P)/FAD-dependent oxidoreductase, partial [Roseovarius indicus]